MQPWNLRQLQVALHYEWARIPKNGVRHYMLSILPRYDAFIAEGEIHAPFLMNLIKVNSIGRDRDIHSIVKNLSFLKMTPCLYTGIQHERISVKLLHYSMN